MRRTSGWRMIGTVFAAVHEVPALQPLARIGQRPLVGALGDRHALEADAEARAFIMMNMYARPLFSSPTR